MSLMSIEEIEWHIKDNADQHAILHQQLKDIKDGDLEKESILLDLPGNNKNRVSTYYRDCAAKIRKEMNVLNTAKAKLLQYEKDYHSFRYRRDEINNEAKSRPRSVKSRTPTARLAKNTVGYHKNKNGGK